MAELDFTNIANGSISTPASGVTALFVDTTKRLSLKDDTGAVSSYQGDGVLSVNVAGGVDITLTASQFTANMAFDLTGLLTASINLIIPIGYPSTFIVDNGSTGAFTVTVKHPSTGGIIAVQNYKAQYYTDGVTVDRLSDINGIGFSATPTTTYLPVVSSDNTSFYMQKDTTNGLQVADNWMYYKMVANGSAVNAIQDFFTTPDGIPMAATACYEIEWHCYFAIAALGGTVTFTLTNTGTLTNQVAHYIGTPIGGMAAVGTPQIAGIVTNTTAVQALPVTGTLTITTNHYFKITALVDQLTAGNLRLRTTCGATTTLQPLRGSYLKARRLPGLNTTSGNTGTFAA